MNVVETGRLLMRITQEQLLPELRCEGDAHSDALTELLEMKGTVVEALFAECQEALFVLTQFALSGQQTHEHILDRYWAMVASYLEFLAEFMELESEVTRIITLDDKKSVKNRRWVLEKATIQQILYTVNEFGLHNQARLIEYLEKTNLLQTLLDLRLQWYVFEVDDQIVNQVENLICLIGYDASAAECILRQQIKNAVLAYHAEQRSLELLKKQSTSLRMPTAIDVPLSAITNVLHQVSNNPLFIQVLTQSEEFSLYNQMCTAPPPPPAKDGKPVQPAQPKSIVVVSWNLKRDSSPQTLNATYVSLVRKVCANLVQQFCLTHPTIVDGME